MNSTFTRTQQALTCSKPAMEKPEQSGKPVSNKVNSNIQSECGKLWTRKTPNTETFHEVMG